MNFENPLIVQSDKTFLLDVHAPLAEECRNDLIPFAELEKSPEHLHTYRLTPLSLWNASSAGFGPEDAIAVLEKYVRYDVPQSGCFGVPRFFVKTHQGIDFDDTGAKFSKLLFKLKGFKEID